MLKFLFISILISVSFFSVAEPKSWMGSEDSDQLGLYVSVYEECPFNQSQLRSKIEGEYIRARIKPTESIGLFLEVNVSCMELKIDNRSVGYVVNYDTSFGSNLFDTIIKYRFPQYGTMAVGSDASSTRFFINSIAESAEEALTDYLKANMTE
ncbi:MAG: hypothetical protein JXQ95_13245 [Alteromonas stellipolaris]|uniref:hypothetical protein n=1 Tax=Alteromonas stellipolaris TaxID=233316 RepID=UPI003B8E4398